LLDQAWQRNAACRGPAAVLFYPPSTPETRSDREGREARAKAMCAECPVCLQCREHALGSGEPHGIWGGLTEVERRVLLETRPD
jgi:WhiB family redox-sensing transcriptional regulator